jgi:hypothetical protein
MFHPSSSRIGLGLPKVTHLGEYTPSSKSLQASFAVLLAMLYSFCKEILILELLQASSLQKSQYLFLGVVLVPPGTPPQNILILHGLQYLTPYP